MLERMSDFFEARLDGYDEHMLTCIEGAEAFYPFTASLLPRAEAASVLDLGCGTGLELDYFFCLNPTADITGVWHAALALALAVQWNSTVKKAHIWVMSAKTVRYFRQKRWCCNG